MSDEMPTDIDDWTFPELQVIEDYEEIELDVDSDMRHGAMNIKPSPGPESNQIVEEEEQEQNEIELVKQELEKTKSSSAEKILIMNKMIEELKYPISIVEDQVIDVLIDIIKKISFKIIQKEITLDRSIIYNMINDLSSLIHENGGMISVSISKEDYMVLELENNTEENNIIVDNSLNKGDIIVKSNHSEIRAILDERIDSLIRIEYD